MKMIDPNEVKTEVSGKGEMLFEVKLPSKGKHGYSSILTLRPLKVSDVKPLIASQILNEVEYTHRVIDAIGKTVVKPEDLDIKELTIEDFIKVLVAHRVNSLGKTFDMIWDCDGCGKGRQTVSVNLISLKEVDIDSKYPAEPVELESGVKFRMPRIRMFFKDGLESIEDLTDYDLVQDALVDLTIDDLLLSDYNSILEFIKKWRGYGIQKEVKAKCRECGKEVELTLPFFLFLAR